MTRLVRILVFAIPFAAAAALALSAAATTPQALRIDMVGHLTGPSTAAGTWTSSGLVTDAGTYTETFRFAGDTIHGEKLLVGHGGTLVLRVQAVVAWIDACTATFKAGSWQIAGGTGGYQSFAGGGEPAAEPSSFGNVCTGQIRIAHAGRAHTEENGG